MDRSPREVAELLGVHRSRVSRACRNGEVECDRDAASRWRLSAAAVQQLGETWGRVPVRPVGLDRESTLILAVLVRHTRGLPSARALAALTRLAPSTVTDRLVRLSGAGLVERFKAEVVMWGRATTERWWRPDWTEPGWDELLPALHQVELPSPRRAASGSRLPSYLRHLVWNGEPAAIDTANDAEYLAGRVLEAHDVEATAWAAEELPASAWMAAADHRGRRPEDVTFARAMSRVDA